MAEKDEILGATPGPATPDPAAPDPSTPDPATRAAAARAVGLVKTYGKGDTEVRALDGVSVEFGRNEFTAIMGPSGSGKSTLMHVMAGLDSATGGEAYIGETDLSQLNDKQLTALRRDRLGFIFQSFNLVPTLTAAENITLPTNIAGGKVDPNWFDEVTDRLGLSKRLDHRPAELSGGQQQRVACARALVSRPELIFGDEPTGNLDSNASKEVLTFCARRWTRTGRRWSLSPMTPAPPPTPTAWCSSATATSSTRCAIRTWIPSSASWLAWRTRWPTR